MLRIYQSLQSQLRTKLEELKNSYFKIVVGGFSLGGGLARLMAYDLLTSKFNDGKTNIRTVCLGEVRTGFNEWQKWWAARKDHTSIVLADQIAQDIHPDPMILFPPVTNGACISGFVLSVPSMEISTTHREFKHYNPKDFDTCAELRYILKNSEKADYKQLADKWWEGRYEKYKFATDVVARVQRLHRLDIYMKYLNVYRKLK